MAAMQRASTGKRVDGSPARRARQLARTGALSGRAVAAIGIALLGSAGAAAAGVTPSPFPWLQSHESAPAMDNVDVTDGPEAARSDQPGSSAEAAQPLVTDTSTETTITAVIEVPSTAATAPPDSAAISMFGLCQAYLINSAEPRGQDASGTPPPFAELIRAAATAGQPVDQFCAGLTPGGSDTSVPAVGPPASPPPAPVPGGGVPSDGPSVTAPGTNGNTPAVTAPGRGDSPPSITAPGRPDDLPSATAPGQPDQSPSITAPGRSGDRRDQRSG